MRENQGLQVAVVLFASTSVVLAVTTFIYFQSSAEQRQRSERAQQQLLMLQQKQLDVSADLTTVRRVVTENDSASVRQIAQTHRADVARVQPDASRHVRPTYQRLVDHLLSATAAVAAREMRLRGDLLSLRADQQRERGQHISAMGEFQQAAAEREAEIAAKREDSQAEQSRKSQQIDRLAQHAQLQSRQLTKTQAEFDVHRRALVDKLEQFERQYAIVRGKWESTQVDSFEQPDGEITYVEGRTSTVHINLGKTDGLRRGMTFGVYDPVAAGVDTASKKATIEVTHIDGQHTAQARIVQDKLSDPILTRDLIFTPLWSADQPRRFCLIGIVDVNGDRKHDGELIRRKLAQQGAVVEAEVDPQGQVTGELTPATRYIVVGTRPDSAADAVARSVYDQMLTRAVDLGIDQLSPGKLRGFLNLPNERVVPIDSSRTQRARF